MISPYSLWVSSITVLCCCSTVNAASSRSRCCLETDDVICFLKHKTQFRPEPITTNINAWSWMHRDTFTVITDGCAATPTILFWNHLKVFLFILLKGVHIYSRYRQRLWRITSNNTFHSLILHSKIGMNEHSLQINSSINKWNSSCPDDQRPD